MQKGYSCFIREKSLAAFHYYNAMEIIDNLNTKLKIDSSMANDDYTEHADSKCGHSIS